MRNLGSGNGVRGLSRRRYGAEYPELVKLGFPVLVTQLGVILMSFADTMMVGAYGVDELAASAFINNVYLIPMVMLSGLAAGLTPLVGALFTKDDHSETGRIVKAGLQINALVALIFTALMGTLYFFLDRFGQPDEIMPAARPYFLTLLATMVPMSLFNTFTQTSNGVTDTKSPMWFILGAIALNIFLNWLLIFGKWGCPELGLTGAGIATLIARIGGFAGIYLMYRRSKRYEVYRATLFNVGKVGAQRHLVWVTSYPVMIQTGVECMLWSFGAVVCGWFGKIQLAAYQVVNTIGQLGFMIYMSFGVAVSIRVANFCGLGDEKGAGLTARAGLHINLVLATLASLLLWLTAPRLLGLFTDNEAVILAGETFILPLVLYQYLDATQMTFMNAIRGTSQVKPMLWIALISYAAIGVPVLLLFAVTFHGESVGVYYSFNVALLSVAVLAALVFKKIKI